MIKITLPVENPQIEINGIVFDLQMSEVEIMARANELQKKWSEKYSEKPASEFTPEQIIPDMQEACSFIDEMLGAGATKRLSHGRPVRLQLMIRWITRVAEAAAATYAEAVTGE